MRGADTVNDEFEVGFKLKMHRSWFGRIVDGTPVVGFEHGRFNDLRMNQLRLTKQDVMTAARQRGLI